MAPLVHELWVEEDGSEMLCLAGPMGDDARRLLGRDARLVWTVTGESHFDVMTKYYAFRERGPYETDEALDHEAYPEEWLTVQQSRRSSTD